MRGSERFPEILPLVRLCDLRQDKPLLPKARGLYGLFFTEAPGETPTRGCHWRDGLVLLYIGSAGANLRLGGTLRNRLGDHHLGGNERRSTICQTLAALMPSLVGPAIKRLERGNMKFHTSPEGAAALRNWMDAKIHACWIAEPDPARLEQNLVHHYATPLNLDLNVHPFRADLSALREARRSQAI